MEDSAAEEDEESSDELDEAWVSEDEEADDEVETAVSCSTVEALVEVCS